MNVTLSIDDQLVARARKLARSRRTSLNQMIRRFLEEVTVTSSRELLVEELERLWREDTGDSGGEDWKRGDLYDRPVLL